MRGALLVIFQIVAVLSQIEDNDYDDTDELEEEASVSPPQKYVAPRTRIQLRQGKSINAGAMVDKLVEAVRRTETEPMIEALSKMLGDPEMEKNPRKLKSEILALLKDPKFRKAAEGRRTVKAIKLPRGIVKLLNSKIPVKVKWFILQIKPPKMRLSFDILFD